VAGLDVVRDATALRRRIGLAGQYAAVDEKPDGRREPRDGRPPVRRAPPVGPRPRDELLEQFDLVDAGRRPAKTYSGGMRRRLDLAAALVARRPSCSSTSRRPAWTRARGWSCGARSSGSSPTAPRSC
jgi:ABC-2 type transport system ATP-binding protein